MTAPRYQDVAGAGHPRGRRRRRDARAGGRAATSGARRDRWKASPPIRATSTCRCRRARRKRSPVETSRHAFAYVFAGSGTFRDASEPRAVLTEQTRRHRRRARCAHERGNRSLVLFDRGDEVVVQAGDAGHPLPARLGQADRGAGRVVRADRDEHAGRSCGRRITELQHGTFIK